jgi:acetyl-CoA C-acetyltransferase
VDSTNWWAQAIKELEMEKDVVIVAGVRTPFGRFGGSLRNFDVYDLSAMVMKEVLRRVNIDGSIVDEVYWGVGDTAQCKDVYTPVVARQALIKAGLPPETVSLSLDTACCSAMTAMQLAWRAIRLGDIQVAIAGGATMFSQEPLILRGLRWRGNRLGHVQLEDPLYFLGYKDFAPVAVDTGEVALEHGVTREEQDKWALRSHQRYGKAWKEGKFKDEMMPIQIPQEDGTVKTLDIDEQYRSDTSLEKLAKLPTVYGSLTVTAGNAPGLNDGATALLVMSRRKAEELGLKPLGTIVTMARACLKPRLLAEVPAAVIDKALSKANLTLDDMRLIEINEAFAAQPLVSTKILAEKYYGGDERKLEELREKTNVNGGAVAIGHPNTASGARLIMTLIYELIRQGGGFGVASICGGLAQGDATIVKV